MWYDRRTAAHVENDPVLIWGTLLLLALGLVMVYSASIAMAEADRATGHRSSYFLVRHALYVGLGLSAAMAVMQVPIRLWQKAAPYLFVAGIVLLVMVLIPGVGREVNGSRRWLSLVVVTLQPSEFMKLIVVLYAADYTVRKAAFMHSFKRGFLPMFGVMFLTGVLLLKEPDFGAFVVITAIAMAILFLGGLNWRLFVGLAVLLVLAFIVLIVTSPYRLQRFIAFTDPFADPFGKGYQLSHALMAFGRGHLFGVGLGGSVEKLLYLPEAHTDFLLAVIAEELGLVGVCAVLVVFAFLIHRAFTVGARAASLERYFAALVAQGIGVWLAVQGIINMGVNMGVVPTKGLTLPLLSFGGSGILANCLALGVLMRIDYENRCMRRGATV